MLIGFNEAGVTFHYKGYRRIGADRQQVMTLTANEFIRRLLLHALPRGLPPNPPHGLLVSGTRKDNIERARQLLAVATPAADTGPVEPTDARPPCPYCGGEMVIVEIVERRYQPRSPSPIASASGRSAS